jgi:lipopolysaccharide export LptBFGC system permease protein LptF
MRGVVLTIALAFIVLLAYLTIVDFVRHGVTALGVVGAIIVVFFAIGIGGVLRHPPDQ